MSDTVTCVRNLLRRASQRLRSESAMLDAELLLAHVLDRSRTWLWTWPDHQPDATAVERFWALVERRVHGEPVAYLTGTREFWSLTLQVNASTLIPRADTEILVEQALALALPEQAQVLDLGTGTGAIALALAHERPTWQICGVDRQIDAVTLARANAQDLGLARVRLLQSDWFSALADTRWHLIVSNPPYIDPLDSHVEQGDVRYEPRSALVAPEHGLADLRQIIEQAPTYLQAGGWLLLEHGYDQAEAVARMLAARGFEASIAASDLGGHVRVSGGCWNGTGRPAE